MPTAGDIVEVVIPWDDNANPSVYISGFGFEALSGAIDFKEISDDFHTALVKASSGGLLWGVTNNLSVTNQRVRDIKPGTGATQEFTYTTVVGSESSDRLPPQDAAVLSWHTALAGRSFRGRTYLPGQLEGDQSNGRWTSGHLSVLQDLIDNFIAVFGPSGTNAHWRFGVISRITAGAPRPSPIITRITGGTHDAQVFTQRRRVAGRGS